MPLWTGIQYHVVFACLAKFSVYFDNLIQEVRITINMTSIYGTSMVIRNYSVLVAVTASIVTNKSCQAYTVVARMIIFFAPTVLNDDNIWLFLFVQIDVTPFGWYTLPKCWSSTTIDKWMVRREVDIILSIRYLHITKEIRESCRKL